MYGPGDEIKGLDLRNPHNQGLVDRGQVVKVQPRPKPKAEPAKTAAPKDSAKTSAQEEA